MDKREIFSKSIVDAKKWMSFSKDPAHDSDHSMSVSTIAVQVGKEIEYPDILLIEVMCAWHDVGRLFSPVHEELSAQIAKYNLLGYGCDENTVHTIYQGIRFHKWNMKPKTLEGHILKDADKLDFISIPRWKKCVKGNRLEHMFPIIELLPKLRRILKLEVSKKIFDTKIQKFIAYIKTDEDLRNSSLFSQFSHLEM